MTRIDPLKLLLAHPDLADWHPERWAARYTLVQVQAALNTFRLASAYAPFQGWYADVKRYVVKIAPGAETSLPEGMLDECVLMFSDQTIDWCIERLHRHNFTLLPGNRPQLQTFQSGTIRLQMDVPADNAWLKVLVEPSPSQV